MYKSINNMILTSFHDLFKYTHNLDKPSKSYNK